MADPMQAIAELVKAVPELSKVPQCALPAFGAIAAAGCGPDLKCICGNDNFYLTLQGVIVQGAQQGLCTPIDAQASLPASRSVCTKAVPWLKDSRAPEIFAAITILMILATLSVVLRVVARRLSSLKFGADDWLIIVALVWSWGLTITQYIALHLGLGKHFIMLENGDLVPFIKAYLSTSMIFPVSVIAIKLSVLVFYHRIFPMRAFRHISIAIGVLSIIWFIIYVFIVGFLCRPLAYWWDKSIPGGKCISAKTSAYYGTSPLDIVTNFALLILPLPYLWKLQMQTAKKVAISFIFLLASFATVGSIVRIPMVQQLKETDIPYSITNPAIWLNVECNIGILSACLPVLRPLFNSTFPSTIRSRLSRTHTSRYGSQRLPDVEKNTGASTTLGSGGTKAEAYAVAGGKGHRSWFDTAVTGKGGDSDDGSQEEMVPMGRIAVRHEVDWVAGERERESVGGRSGGDERV